MTSGGGRVVIYADILFLVNLYVDYFILLGVKKFYNLRTKTSRLLLGAVTGAVVSLISLFMLNDIINYILALIFGLLVCFASFYDGNIKILIKYYASFLFISFAFSGIVLMLSFLTKSAAVIGGKPYFQISPLLLLIFTSLSYGASELMRILRGKGENPFLFHKIVVEQNGCIVELFAKKDTGNDLKEPFSGLPVVVAEKDSLKEIKTEKTEIYRLVPFNTLGGSGLIPAFKPEKMYLKKDGKEVECYLAVFDGKLSHGSYNCLINPQILM